MRFNVLIQQAPIPVYNQYDEITDHRANFLKIRDVQIEAVDPEIALCKAKARFPQFGSRLIVSEQSKAH